MPRRPLSDDEIAAFRDRLVKVATRQFAVHGFEGVTMRSVADAMGVSAMTSYRYVADKETLLDLVRAQAYRRFAEMQAAVAGRRLPPAKRLRALGRAYMDFALRQPDAYRIMFVVTQSQEPSAELVAEAARCFSYLREAVSELAEAEQLDADPLTLANLFWATAHGIVSLHLANRLTNGRDVHELAHELSQLLARGFATSSRTRTVRPRKKQAKHGK